MTVNVEDLTREQLENIVIQQSKQLQSFEARNKHLSEALEKSENDYEVLAGVIMNVRGLVNSGLTQNPEESQDD